MTWDIEPLSPELKAIQERILNLLLEKHQMETAVRMAVFNESAARIPGLHAEQKKQKPATEG